MKCLNCGQELADNCLFCTSCGAKIIQGAAAPQTSDQTESTVAQNAASGNAQPDPHEAEGAIPQQPNYLPQQQPSPNLNTCKVCGGQINPKTKVCSTCGKQYFKMSAVFISLICVSVAAIILAVFSITKITSLNHTVTAQQSSIESLNDELNSYQDKVDFMDRYVVIEVEGDTTYYHKFGCSALEGKSFWIYNITAAKTQGYIPDPLCN